MDRVIDNPEWSSLHENAQVRALPIQFSDHSPIILDTETKKRRKERWERLENFWLQYNLSQTIVKRMWFLPCEGTPLTQVCRKQRWTMKHFRNWYFKDRKSLASLIEETKGQLEILQKKFSEGRNGKEKKIVEVSKRERINAANASSSIIQMKMIYVSREIAGVEKDSTWIKSSGLEKRKKTRA